MSDDVSISRREFLEKTTLVASAAGLAAGAKKARAQLNNGVQSPPGRVGVAFIGVGIRGTILYKDSLPVAGVEPVAVCDIYQGHLDCAKENLGNNIFKCILSSY